jgi:xanthine dehydrogenase accessory factor
MDSLGLPGAIEEAERLRKAGEGGIIATVVSSTEGAAISAGTRMVIGRDGQTIGSLHPALDGAVSKDARPLFASKRSVMSSYRLTDKGAERVGVRGGDVDVFLEILATPPRLVIVGAGHIAVPLARIASLAEFHVIVVDDRPEFGNRERFPDAEEIRVGPYRETFRDIALDGDTYVVLVTRGHVHDLACLELAIQTPAAYIGMIGSKLRIRTLMANATRGGIDPGLLGHVYAPIGLDIGSHTPAEIAIAIMAEIVNVRRGGSAPSLSRAHRQAASKSRRS